MKISNNGKSHLSLNVYDAPRIETIYTKIFNNGTSLLYTEMITHYVIGA